MNSKHFIIATLVLLAVIVATCAAPASPATTAGPSSTSSIPSSAADNSNPEARLPAPYLDNGGSMGESQFTDAIAAKGTIIWGCDKFSGKCGVDVGANGAHVLSTYAAGAVQIEGELVAVQPESWVQTRTPRGITLPGLAIELVPETQAQIANMDWRGYALSAATATVLTVLFWNVQTKAGTAAKATAGAEHAAAETARLSDDVLRATVANPAKFADMANEAEKAGLISHGQMLDSVHIVQDGGAPDKVLKAVKDVMARENAPLAKIAVQNAARAAKDEPFFDLTYRGFGMTTIGKTERTLTDDLLVWVKTDPTKASLWKEFGFKLGPLQIKKASGSFKEWGGSQWLVASAKSDTTVTNFMREAAQDGEKAIAAAKANTGAYPGLIGAGSFPAEVEKEMAAGKGFGDMLGELGRIDSPPRQPLTPAQAAAVNNVETAAKAANKPVPAYVQDVMAKQATGTTTGTAEGTFLREFPVGSPQRAQAKAVADVAAPVAEKRAALAKAQVAKSSATNTQLGKVAKQIEEDDKAFPAIEISPKGAISPASAGTLRLMKKKVLPQIQPMPFEFYWNELNRVKIPVR